MRSASTAVALCDGAGASNCACQSGIDPTSMKLGNVAEAEAGVRPHRRARHRLQRARREIPVQPEEASTSGPTRRSAAHTGCGCARSRASVDGGKVAASSIVGHTSRQRPGTGQRRAVAEARGSTLRASGLAVEAVGARRPHARRRHGLSPEHRRQRHRRWLRRPRPPRRIQDRPLRLTLAENRRRCDEHRRQRRRQDRHRAARPRPKPPRQR